MRGPARGRTKPRKRARVSVDMIRNGGNALEGPGSELQTDQRLSPRQKASPKAVSESWATEVALEAEAPPAVRGAPGAMADPD